LKNRVTEPTLNERALAMGVIFCAGEDNAVISYRRVDEVDAKFLFVFHFPTDTIFLHRPGAAPGRTWEA
jgi:hypothetical protein